ncbi:hypothetical protein D6827_03740 [Candidatus Parcubacteria bacterium]|nr:MAG: hypothetical protein D6827_03740 [Candidatus Parcubacteria bacterium]
MHISKALVEINKLIAESELEYHYNRKAQLHTLHIYGALSAIPSLKNSKLPNKNFINPKVRNRLIGLTKLFNATVTAPVTFKPKQLVFCLVMLGKKCRVRDTDNALASIKDWLEPPTKRNRNKSRGWGIGLVNDDAYVHGICLRQKDFGYNDSVTSIYLLPFEDLLLPLENLIGEITQR